MGLEGAKSGAFILRFLEGRGRGPAVAGRYNIAWSLGAFLHVCRGVGFSQQGRVLPVAPPPPAPPPTRTPSSKTSAVITAIVAFSTVVDYDSSSRIKFVVSGGRLFMQAGGAPSRLRRLRNYARPPTALQRAAAAQRRASRRRHAAASRASRFAAEGGTSLYGSAQRSGVRAALPAVLPAHAPTSSPPLLPLDARCSRASRASLSHSSSCSPTWLACGR